MERHQRALHPKQLDDQAPTLAIEHDTFHNDAHSSCYRNPKYKKQRLCLHSAHLPQQSAQVRHAQETSPDLDHDLSLQEVHQAYDRLRGRQLGSAVFISDLAAELQIGLPKLHEWISSEVIESGHGSLDEGHWPTATAGQRAWAIEHR